MTPDEELTILRADWAALVAQVTGGESRRAAEDDIARKLAAFPDLLEALRALTDAVERFTNASPDDWPELVAARAAIAKATGEQP
jgi:hypothetical protein